MLTLTNRIDMRPGAVPLVIHLGQYDSDFTLVFELYSSAGNFTVESGTTAMIRGTKTDGHAYDADATIDVSAKTVTVAGSEQMTAAKGRNVYELVLTKSGKVLSTANFILDVERAAMDADTIASESVLKELNAIIAGAETATDAAQTATAAAESVSGSTAQIAINTANIATNTADISDLKADLSAEQTARQASDTAIITDIEALGEDVEANYAQIDGSYDSLGAGVADQLASTQRIEDSDPYLYRQSGGSAAIGNREYDSIVGGSVVWNQLEQMNRTSNTVNGITYTNNRDGSFTISGTATQNDSFYPSNTGTSSDAIIGHKYLAYSDIKNPSMSYICVGIYVNSTPKKVIGTSSTIYSADASGKIQIGYRYASGAAIDSITVKGGLHDLTAMFGTTIADYIYSLEQSSTGAGVAFFRKLFPNDYYAYNAGELMSVSALQSHEMVGFNQWDEETEAGGINDTTGEKDAGTIGQIRSKNYIPCEPNTTYYVKAGSNVFAVFGYCYDVNKNFIGRIYVNPADPPDRIQNKVITTLEGSHFLLFRFRYSDYGTTYNHDICINLSDPSRNGTYEPYVKHSYPLDSTLTLRGIPKVDSNGKLYYDGDVYAHDGTVTRKYGVVDLGMLTWSRLATSQDGKYRFGSCGLVDTISKPTALSVVANIVCSMYDAISADKPVNNVQGISVHTNGNVIVYDDLLATDDVAAFKTAMSGVMLIYELATPTTEIAEPYASPQVVDPYGTERYVTTGIVPVGHNTKYLENLRAKLEGLPTDFSTLIAVTEKTATASRSYAVGDYLILNNTLYKVTSAIASGATITAGTNVQATTIMAEIKALG